MGPHKPRKSEHAAYLRPGKASQKYEVMSEVAKRTEIEDMIDDDEVGLDAVFGKYKGNTSLLEFALSHSLQKGNYVTVDTIRAFLRHGVRLNEPSHWFDDESPGSCLKNSSRPDHVSLVAEIKSAGISI